MRHPITACPVPPARKGAKAGARLAAGLGLLALAALSGHATPSSWPLVPGPGAAVEAEALHEGQPPGPPPGVAGHPSAQSMPGRAGRLVDFQGPVWLFDTAVGRWEEGLRNRALTGGDRLSTGPGGRAEVRIGSTELRLGPRTELEFVDIAEDRLVWRLTTGSLAWRVRRHEIARETELRAASVRVRADSPGHYRVDVDDEVVWTSAWRGSLRVDSGDQLVSVAAGRRAEFMRPGPGRGTAVTWSAPERDAFSDWVARDEARDDQVAVASAAYVSPEMTGAEDLDRHGRWDPHPQYGVVWTPLVVVAGWEPFRHGRWVWHARWGWTWVDAAPWGFAPFHYGRWIQWGGRWSWVPGPYLARPVFSPALVVWQGSAGGGVSVGVTLHGRYWAPLPPRQAPLPPRYAPWPSRPAPQPLPPNPRQAHPSPPHWETPQPRRRPPERPPEQPPRSATPGEVPQPSPVREAPQVASPSLPAPVDAADRHRRFNPGERPPRGGSPEGAERPRPGARPKGEERQESAAEAAPPPTRARVPEAMRDRPRDRQQTM